MIKKFLTLILLITLIIGIGLFYYQNTVNSSFANEGTKNNDVNFVIEEGDNLTNIATRLENMGLIKSALVFKIYTKRERAEEKLQAGEYILNPILSIKKIVKVLTSGEVVKKELTIKIIEGWNIKDIDEYLTENNIINQNEFVEQAKVINYKNDFEFLSELADETSLEGYLFPDTYRIFENSSVDDIIKKMLANFDKKITADMKEAIATQDKTLPEIINLASIVEKEVRSIDDMKTVAGIFNNRLRDGQPLQSCATLAYILGVNKKRYSLEDTQVDSYYNTYLYPDLPPGPISNPGLNAIKATIYPTETDYYFFLSSSDSGETIFSKTLEEHNINKQKYLK